MRNLFPPWSDKSGQPLKGSATKGRTSCRSTDVNFPPRPRGGSRVRNDAAPGASRRGQDHRPHVRRLRLPILDLRHRHHAGEGQGERLDGAREHLQLRRQQAVRAGQGDDRPQGRRHPDHPDRQQGGDPGHPRGQRGQHPDGPLQPAAGRERRLLGRDPGRQPQDHAETVQFWSTRPRSRAASTRPAS